jgi:hypothetical protein
VRDITEHLMRLFGQVLYLEHQAATKGATHHRLADIEAIDWALDRLAEVDPEVAKVIDRAEKLADERWAKLARR